MVQQTFFLYNKHGKNFRTSSFHFSNKVFVQPDIRKTGKHHRETTCCKLAEGFATSKKNGAAFLWANAKKYVHLLLNIY